MITVIVSDSAGHRTNVTAAAGTSLMEAIKGAGLDLVGVCGGSLACATCHVIVDADHFPRVGTPSEDEEDMLDQAFNVARTSRLSCQIILDRELDGLAVRLP